jgi:hypothetical protein
MATASDPQKARDDIDAELGERYYRDRPELEEQYTREIIALIRAAIDKRFHEGKRPARRDAHAFDNGCVSAVFRVDANLKPHLRHGIFVPGREYPAWIRFSNGNVEPRSRWWPDARGMAIKLMGVEGQKLLDDEKHPQDFILLSHPVFFVDDLERYKATLEAFLEGGVFAQYVRSPLRLKGREILLALIVNFRWLGNPLFQQYWSMTPYRLGAGGPGTTAVKYTAKPRLARKPSLYSRLTAYLAWEFSPKKEMHDALAGTDMWFDFYVQRHVDDRTPIEDSKVEWREKVSPPEHVAKIVIPSQPVMSPDRDWFCENLSFSPWHGLPAHKPLGLVNRVRRQVYLEISRHRHMRNHVASSEPTEATMPR